MIKNLSIAVLSGKGGVGKSSISLNLALAFAKAQNTSLIMDCDLGLANLDILLGVSPAKNLHDFMNSNSKPEDFLFPLPNLGFDLLPASSGVAEIDSLSEDEIKNLYDKLAKLFVNYDTILLDLGAGIHSTVQNFAKLVNMRIIIISPEPTSLTDAYALIKVLSTKHKIKDFFVIVNQANSKKEIDESFNRLAKVCEHFLKISSIFLGAVRADAKVLESIMKQKPVLELFPKSKATHDIQEIANKILSLKEKM